MKRLLQCLLLFSLLLPVTGKTSAMQATPEKKLLSSLIQTLDPQDKINPEALRLAIQGYDNLKRQGMIKRDGIITLIDFQKSSVEERLFVVDLNQRKVLYSGLVAHGKASGENFATDFSNLPGSNKSSMGFFLTDSTYQGKNGYSLVLKGMERGINDNAEMRSIVMHAGPVCIE